MTPTALHIIEIGLIGLGAGLLGGLAGIGGSLLMLPGLHMVLGDPRTSTHHLYMAAAMSVNVFVALPAAWRHNRAGAVRKELLPALTVATAVAVAFGVFIGNQLRGDSLRLILAGFIASYCVLNLWHLFRDRQETMSSEERVDTPRLAASGGMAGVVGGMLGLGGGVLLVPLLQVISRIPLKQAIATSSAVIWITAIVGAGLKLWTLGGEGERWQDAVILVALLAPGAVIGGIWGAALTERLSIWTVRVVVTGLLAIAACRLAGLF